MTAIRVFTGQLRDRATESFVVLAADEIDAGRFVTATLGDPGSIQEAGGDGLVVGLAPSPAGVRPTAAVAPLALQGSLTRPPSPPA